MRRCGARVMMNFNSHQELASKDCRICNRRRIRCDRRLPTCGKCEKRGLTCSGYGIILKWDQGVASRGNLKGKSLPVKRTDSALPPSCLVERPDTPEVSIHQPGDQFPGITTFSNLEISTIPQPLVSYQLQISDERRLLHHYDHIVAPNMAWADCPENPWRHIIIPLALESPPVLNAILAFAAKHINAVSFLASRESTSMMPVSSPDTFQQRAMKLLAREIHELATAEASRTSVGIEKAVNRNRSNGVLATMLVLCNVETVWPDSPVWQVHLNAARTVMVSRQDTTSTKPDEDSTSAFLEQELFVANTFASTTNFLNFAPNEEYKLKTTISKPSSIFIEFHKLLGMVTNLQYQAITHPDTLANSGVSPSGLRKLFENARSKTLELGRTFQVSGSHDHIHLSRTVNCFYHAGIIYSYRALLNDYVFSPGSSDERQIQITTSKYELFHALGLAETNKPTFAQDLVWPLFIAGTEATQKEDQDMVVSKLQQAMSETVFSNCQHALEFLKALWQKRDWDEMDGNEVDWIVFAREWTAQGKTFLVF